LTKAIRYAKRFVDNQFFIDSKGIFIKQKINNKVQKYYPEIIKSIEKLEEGEKLYLSGKIMN
jgi:DNA replicative helicase MCM subunit Mcm2 (Cdc46/Mcm family)